MSTISTNKSREPVKHERGEKRQVVVWLWYTTMGRRAKIAGMTLVAAHDNRVMTKRGGPTVCFFVFHDI